MKTTKTSFIGALLMGVGLLFTGQHLHAQLNTGDPNNQTNDRQGLSTTDDALSRDGGSPDSENGIGGGTASASGTQRPVLKDAGMNFSFTWDAEYYYNSNIFLSGGSKIYGIDVYQNTFIANLRLGKHRVGSFIAIPRMGVIHQRYYHGLTGGDGLSTAQLNGLDFDNLILYVANTFKTAGGWEYDLGFEYSNIFSLEDDYENTYTGYTPYVNVRKVFPISRNKFFMASGDLRHHFTDVDTFFGTRKSDENDRTDASFTLRYYQILGDFTVTPYYRVAYSNYYNGNYDGRWDLLRTVGLNVIYKINKTFSLKTFTSFDTKDINGNSLKDYQKWTVGVGATARF